MLAIAFVLDGYSLITAWRAFNAHRGNESIWVSIKDSKDAASFTVLFEDGSDVLGLIIAFLGVFLGHELNNPYLDGLASILIGLLLVAVAVVLARESKSLLMGEGVDEETARQLVMLTEADPAVLKSVRIATIYLGPDEITMAQRVVFQDNLTTDGVNQAIVRIHAAMQQAFPAIKNAFTQPVALPDTNETE